jgi:hypothetical protein
VLGWKLPVGERLCDRRRRQRIDIGYGRAREAKAGDAAVDDRRRGMSREDGRSPALRPASSCAHPQSLQPVHILQFTFYADVNHYMIMLSDLLGHIMCHYRLSDLRDGCHVCMYMYVIPFSDLHHQLSYATATFRPGP